METGREVKKMTYTYNRKGITRKVLSEIVRGLGAKDELKILKWQIRIIMEADAVYPYIVYMPKGCRFLYTSSSYFFGTPVYS